MMTMSNKEMNQRIRRGHVMQCLERDEFPYDGWDKEFPDLAAKRKAELASASGHSTDRMHYWDDGAVAEKEEA
jgi:hypothetical protein